MKLLYLALRTESLLLLLIYPFVALASVMGLGAAGMTSQGGFHSSPFDMFMVKSFLWLTLLYPISVLIPAVSEFMSQKLDVITLHGIYVVTG